MPPFRTGIAAYSAEVLGILARRMEIDVYDEPRAHDFVWKQARQPYDLQVYQLGNSLAHAYQWAYLTRYPGLTILHDAHLHQSRALDLLRHHREQDYRAELQFSHPDAPDGIADLFAAGLGGSLYYLWPMLRLAVEASRSVAVHDERLAGTLRASFPSAHVDVVPMGVRPVTHGSGLAVRTRHGISPDALVYGTYGKVTAAKRPEPILHAFARLARVHTDVHLLVAGEPSTELDLSAMAAELGVRDRVTFAGYVADEDLDEYLHAADVCLCLRWPTSGETSAAWLRCLAAGKPTIITNLVQMGDVPRMDWSEDPITVAVDLLDEERSLELAMMRLASHADLRAALGSAAFRYWETHHALERMAGRYAEVMEGALARNQPEKAVSLEGLPHLHADGTALAKRLTAALGVPYPL